MIWVYLSVFAAFMQTWRNSLQSKLSQHINVAGVTLARFIFAGPIAGAYLFGLYQWQDVPIPQFTSHFYWLILAAALCQIIATALMVLLFKQNNFAIGAGLAKSEAIIAAIIGTLFLGVTLTPIGWTGVLIGSFVIFYMSNVKGLNGLSLKTLIIGLACGCGFALTSLAIRNASLSLDLPFLHRSAWVLVLVISIQTLILLSYLLINDRTALKKLFQHPKLCLLTSITSCLGSIGWFTAMSLQTVPYVKTLGQIEVLFTLIFSSYYLNQRVRAKDTISLILIAVAAVMVMWG